MQEWLKSRISIKQEDYFPIIANISNSEQSNVSTSAPSLNTSPKAKIP